VGATGSGALAAQTETVIGIAQTPSANESRTVPR
jgi:hypothetical protein